MMDKSTFETKSVINGPMHAALKHDSAHKHVTGSAEYIDDIPEPAGTLHGGLGLSDRAHAEIVSIDLSAVRTAPGVVWTAGSHVEGVRLTKRLRRLSFTSAFAPTAESVNVLTSGMKPVAF